MLDVESLINPHLRAMQPYAPIAPFEILARRLGLPAESIVKLDANENPYGPPPRVREALARAETIHIYPDPDQTLLREAIASSLGLPAAHILCGAGADEIIDLVARVFVQPGDAILDLPPTFGMYRWIADITNAAYYAAPRRADFSVDVAAIQQLCARASSAGHTPKLLFIADPNNPDGSTISDETLRALLALPLVVVLDEAYVDFSAQPSRAGWVLRHTNLIVLRTFSKLAGMAGLRVGYGVFPLEVIKHLWKVKQPYTPNVAGSLGAIAALSDAAYLNQTVRALVAERERMRERLSHFEWLHVFPSQANFVLCRVDERAPLPPHPLDWPAARRLKHALEQRGVLIRYFDRDGLRDCVRISVGRPDQTDRLLATIQDVLSPTSSG
jgi:histidinol-phosphate aminotransferase